MRTLLLVLTLLVLPMPQDATPPSHGNPYPDDPDALHEGRWRETADATRHGDRAGLGPSGLDSFADHLRRQVVAPAPLGDGQGHAVVLNTTARSGVIGLRDAIAPVAVLRRIGAVVVSALDRSAEWARSHIGREVLKRPPSLTHANPSAAVVLIPSEGRQRATLAHGAPETIQLRSRLAVRPSEVQIVGHSQILSPALTLAGGASQDQTPPSHGNPYPDDPQAYCMAGPPMANDTHGHECHCKMICTPANPNDPDSEMVQREDPACPFYCGQYNAHCLCHADQSCDMPMMEPPK